MTTDTRRFVDFWRERSATFIARACDDIAAHAGPSYAALPRNRLEDAITRTVQGMQASLAAGDFAPLREVMREIAQQRMSEGFEVDETMRVTDILREHLWSLLREFYAEGAWESEVVELVERSLHEHRKAFVSTYGRTFREAQARLLEREHDLEAQSRLIRELSTPIAPIYEGVLVLPLVGAIDSRRANQVMESVLEKIVEYQADVLLLDITGVPIVDTGVANHLIQMARAVTLLGAQVVLVGISASIAQTIVQLGVELRNITTLANLQSGIAYALAQRGFAITATDPQRRDTELLDWI